MFFMGFISVLIGPRVNGLLNSHLLSKGSFFRGDFDVTGQRSSPAKCNLGRYTSLLILRVFFNALINNSSHSSHDLSINASITSIVNLDYK